VQEQIFALLCKGCGETLFLVEIEGKDRKRTKFGAIFPVAKGAFVTGS
jgi:hypothetical protein